MLTDQHFGDLYFYPFFYLHFITQNAFTMSSPNSLRLDVYLTWVNAWLSTPMDNACEAGSPISVDEMASLFQEQNLSDLLSGGKLAQVITSFRHRVDAKEIMLGGSVPPSCDEMSILSQNYNPQTDCSCSGVYPVPSGTTLKSILRQSGCVAIRKMIDVANLVTARENGWNPHCLFTAEHLKSAVSELVLSSADEQAHPDTCLGSIPPITKIQAPDRRPNWECDTETFVYHQTYPTNEQIKLCADAKYFFAIACGGGLCDEGLARAVADAGNDVLVADYCEAADQASLSLLQKVGGAAMAFLKLCHLAGVITD